jgi:subtilisin family serine protease
VPGLVAGNMFSAKFTCFGPQVAIAGPGVAIISTVPGGGYAAWDGTSMATPHITGMGALLLAHHPLLRAGAAARNEQRVVQLFNLLTNAGVRYLGDPTREGAGLPDLQRVPGFGASAQTAGTMQAASAQPGFGNGLDPFGGFVGSPPPGFGINPGNFGINPAIVQRLVQLRAAGLL